MSNKTKVITTGIVSIIVGMFLGAYLFRGVTPSEAVGAASDCSNGYTCLTYLNVLNDLKTDGTFTAAATSTLSDTVNLNNGGICINFYPTSTQTRAHITASTTGTLPSGAAGVLTFDYGACAN